MDKSFLSLRNLLTLLAFAGAVWALFSLSPPMNLRSLHHFWDTGHVVLFFLFCRTLSILLPGFSQKSFRYRALFCLGLAFLLGGGIEIGQLFMSGRTSSFMDLLADVTGAMVYLAFADKKSGKNRPIFMTAAGLLVVFVFSPAVIALYDEWQGIRQFPILADFESPFEKSRFEGKAEMHRNDRYAAHGKHSLSFKTTTENYSGISLHYFPGDWKGFTNFNFSVYNQYERQLQLHCRIHDALHGQNEMRYSDRYNTIFFLKPGWNELRIPLAEVGKAPESRDMDMGRIKGVGFFVAAEPTPLILYLDNLFLN